MSFLRFPCNNQVRSKNKKTIKNPRGLSGVVWGTGRPEAAVNGGLAIAVPLELKGLWVAHQRHGTLPWAQLVTPVIPLARDGFPLHPYLADEIGDGERWVP